MSRPTSSKKLADAFASVSGVGDHREECLIHVYWTGLWDPNDSGRGHLLRRGEVSADLGLDAVPAPPFTDEEMQAITRAAKIQAIKCLRARKRRFG